MIYCLTGKLLEKAPDYAVVSCGGVGYLAAIPSTTAGALPAVGDTCTLYTCMNVTENDVSLFGFADKESQTMFRLLTGVSGVGPKVGLAILSVLSPDRVVLAISAGDHKAFTAASGLADKPVRWIVDDCAKFVAREIRRGVRYDGIIMDPPSYGRGPGGEVWKLEDSIYDFIDLCAGVLSDEPLFVAVNSYTTGLSPSVMEYMLRARVCPRWGGHTACDEIGLPVTATGGVVPCGATAWWLARNAGL